MNDHDINDNYCDVYNVKNHSLVAYPNFLILGNPLRTDFGLKFTKFTYFKIRTCDVKNWFLKIKDCFTFLSSDNVENFVSKIIIADGNVTYSCLGFKDDNNVRFVKITCANDKKLCIDFDKDEIRVLLIGLSELLIHLLCLNNNALKCFNEVLNFYLSINLYDVKQTAENIACISIKDLEKFCEKTCQQLDTEKSNYIIYAQIIFRYKIYMLIIFLIKKCFNPEVNIDWLRCYSF